MQVYPLNTVLDIIKIRDVILEERVRGQIKDSLDWVSIQNITTGHMFMKPIKTMSSGVTDAY